MEQRGLLLVMFDSSPSLTKRQAWASQSPHHYAGSTRRLSEAQSLIEHESVDF